MKPAGINPVDHLIYASSSSVYGSNKKVPFEETDFVDNPVSLYAATKKSNELMAHTYSHLYNIPSTGLRFFTVYGPMGRPDMAYFGFTDKYFKGEPIIIFNNGDFEHDLYRDFTYIDDIIEGVIRLLENPPIKAEDSAPHKVFNIGNNNPEKLMTFIWVLEKALGNALGREVEFEKIFEPIKPGDVPATYASTDRLQEAVGFKPRTSIEEGLQRYLRTGMWGIMAGGKLKGNNLSCGDRHHSLSYFYLGCLRHLVMAEIFVELLRWVWYNMDKYGGRGEFLVEVNTDRAYLLHFYR